MIDENKHKNIIESELDSLSGRITYRTNSTEQPLENNQNFNKIMSNDLLIDNGNYILNKKNNINNNNHFPDKNYNKTNNSIFSNDLNNMSTILNTSNLSSNRDFKYKKRKYNKIKKYNSFKKGNLTKFFVLFMITISTIIFVILFIFF